MNARVQELFHEVADLPAEGRAEYFSVHSVDEQTRVEVEALLIHDAGARAALMRDVSAAATRALPQLEALQLAPKGFRCGPYRLLEVIGRGGMGAVYLAERADGEVDQRVAVKLLPPGAGDLQRERFLLERQILAPLTHPNVARMLDAGHLDNGQPFLAMEYVEGQPIDVFAAGLTVRQKIELLLKICAAVGYLHRNLVVHRDLKPSNILVTPDGEPKLLDFGIAKLLDAATDSTVTSLRMLTPDYASPEQVAGGRISTATDVYSLGAILYRLLTGKPPHEFEDNSLAAVTSAIVTREITRPSKWTPELKGDLESILLKALRKDPQERYATVEQLAEDLNAWAESRPVRARSGNAWYRTRKWVRRYWVPVSAATLVIASLSAGLYVANRERAIAQRRFQDVRQLANKLFDIDFQARQLPGSTKTRQLIVDTALEYLRRLAADVRADPELALEVGNAYMRVARVQGVSVGPNLGQTDNADQSLKIAEKLVQSVLVSQPANRTALLRAAQIAHDRMIVARGRGHYDEALAFARKSAELLEEFHAGKADEPEASAVLVTYLNVAEQHRMEQQFDEALRLSGRGISLARTWNDQRYVGTLLWVSARVHQKRGDLDEALKDIQESVRLLDPGSGAADRGRTMNYILALVYRGRILGDENEISLGRSEEAVKSLERAFRISDEFVHQDANDASSRGRLGQAGGYMADIVRHSDPRRALEIYDHTLRDLAEINNNPSLQRYEVTALAGSSYALRNLGRPEEAQQRLDAAVKRLTKLKMYPSAALEPGSEAAITLQALADHEAATDNLPRAIETYQNLLAGIEAYKPHPENVLEDALQLSNLYGAEAAVHRQAGHHDVAAALDARRLEMWLHWDQRLPNNSFVQRQLRAAGRKVRLGSPF